MKIVATRCHILRLKCTKFDFSCAGLAYSALPDPLAGFQGPTSKGREGRGKGKGEFATVCPLNRGERSTPVPILYAAVSVFMSVGVCPSSMFISHSFTDD